MYSPDFYQEDARRPYREAEAPMDPLRLQALFIGETKALQTYQTTDEVRRALMKLWFFASPADRVAIMIDDVQETAGYENPDEVFTPNPRIIAQMGPNGVVVLDGDLSTMCLPLDGPDRRMGYIYAECSAPWDFNFLHHSVLGSVATIAVLAYRDKAQIQMLRAQNARLQKALDLQHDLVGQSAPMLELQRVIGKVAPTPSTILIQGESGTGKELVARAIHRNGNRSNAPFVAVNCAALTESLLESELFGHERGAFTGANALKKGQFELAAGGTLFLDEVGELAPSIQAKLLRALQEREIKRVGGQREIKVDVRVIAATNRNLDEAVAAKQFREDLLYRLKVISIKAPPLRERREDISVLARHFVEKYQRMNGRLVRGVSREAEAVLGVYDWPGNVRELQNVIERAVVLGSGDMVEREDLPEELLHAAGVAIPLPTYDDEVSRVKRVLIEKALVRTGGDCAKAAEMIGLNPKSLYKLVRNLNLSHLRK